MFKPIIKTNGCTRIVILIDRWAIKIPNMTYSHHHWLLGCVGNWSERKTTKMYKSVHDWGGDPDLYSMLSPTIWCSWFGLVSIQMRTAPISRDLTMEEKELYKALCDGDAKRQNFGMLNGVLVCHDYAE